MTESCEWRGQIWIRLRATGTKCLQGSLGILHSWRFSIRPEWIGGFVDLDAGRRRQTKHVACILEL